MRGKSAQLVAETLPWAQAWAEGLPVQGAAEITGSYYTHGHFQAGEHASAPLLLGAP